MAKEGYYGNNPEAILEAPIDIILGILKFEKVSSDYESTYMEMNKTHG